MTLPTVIVTAPLDRSAREAIAAALDGHAEIVTPADSWPQMCSEAEVVIAQDVAAELGPVLHGGGLPRLKFLQLLAEDDSGLDRDRLARHVVVAGVGPVAAELLAERVMALALTAAKRLLIEHRRMQAGEFNQFGDFNLELAGGVCAIVGYGPEGRAVARAMRCLGMKIFTIDDAPVEEAVDFRGTAGDIGHIARLADVLVLTTRLHLRDGALVDARVLHAMKEPSILVDAAEGGAVDTAVLQAHLAARPRAFACVTAAPERHPLFGCANFVGAPRLTASDHRAALAAARRVAANVTRFLGGRLPLHLLGPLH